MREFDHANCYAEVMDARSCRILKEILEVKWHKLQDDILYLKTLRYTGVKEDIKTFQAELDSLSTVLKRLNARIAELSS